MRAMLICLALLLSLAQGVEARELGKGREVILIRTLPVVVYTYRPHGCAEPKLLFAFAGYDRDADKYRDRAVDFADRACLIVMAPLFDRERFPNWRYHRAGVWHNESLQPPDRWTGPLLFDLIAWGREWSNRPNAAYILFGHSAGAQFLSRISAYTPPSGAHRIVIANPSVYVMPSLKEPVPYGFHGIFEPEERVARLRDYLALPITIYVGTEDTGERLLVQDEAAMRQGSNRYERGKNVFRTAQELARQHDWSFAWRLVEVPDAGHSSKSMLDARQAEDAFGLRRLEFAR